MNKLDLKNGMIVQFKSIDGLMLVLGDCLYSINGYEPLENYDDDLYNINSDSFDIIVVYTVRFKTNDLKALLTDTNLLNCIWRNPEFPIYAQDTGSSLVVKFESKHTGTVVVANDDYEFGDRSNGWPSCFNTDEWKIIPKPHPEELTLEQVCRIVGYQVIIKE